MTGPSVSMIPGFRIQLPLRRGLVCLFCLLLSFALAAGAATSQRVQKSTSLEPGKPLERELSGGESHSYQLNVATGQYAYVIVDQKGIDVVASLFGPDGKLITAVDNPNGSNGAEPVHITAEATGTYTIEVTSFDKNARPGRYEVKLEELRPATQTDRDRLAARRAFDSAERLQMQNTRDSLPAERDSLPAAIKKYEEALDLYRVIGDRSEEFTVLIGMGSTETTMHQLPHALERFDQALIIAQELGDKFRQARALQRSAIAYLDLDLEKSSPYERRVSKAISCEW